MYQSESELLRLPEFAAALRVTTGCVRRWLREGRVNSIKVGSLRCFLREEVDRIIRLGIRPATRPFFRKETTSHDHLTETATNSESCKKLTQEAI